MGKKVFLTGCGILKKEINLLIRKNDWPVETQFLSSELHADYGSLADALQQVLCEHRKENTVVFYGYCHPWMDEMVGKTGARRTLGQNCAEFLLGPEIFTRELENGAFFLFEEWTHDWDKMIAKSLGTDNREVIRDIFRTDRRYLLCLRTPCSSGFSERAGIIGDAVDLPVRWMDVTLDHLESVLQNVLYRKPEEI